MSKDDGRVCVVSETFLREAVPEMVVGELLRAFDQGVREFTIRSGGGVVGVVVWADASAGLVGRPIG